MSKNHQFIQFGDKVVKRYVRTRNQAVTGYRLDPQRPENQLDFLLMSPETDFEVQWKDGEEVKVIRIKFDYGTEVLELYSETEAKLFPVWNRKLIENGLLREFSGTAPELDVSNILSDTEIRAIAAIKTTAALEKKVKTITSVDTLNLIYKEIELLDRPMSIAAIVKNRIQELKT